MIRLSIHDGLLHWVITGEPGGVYVVERRSPPQDWNPFLVVTNESGERELFSIPDGKTTPLAGVEKNEDIIRWGPTPDSMYVFRPYDLPIRIYRIGTQDGRRQLAKEIQPTNTAGVFGNIYVFTTADAQTTVYGLRRYLIDLYLVKGLR